MVSVHGKEIPPSGKISYRYGSQVHLDGNLWDKLIFVIAGNWLLNFSLRHTIVLNMYKQKSQELQSISAT